MLSFVRDGGKFPGRSMVSNPSDGRVSASKVMVPSVILSFILLLHPEINKCGPCHDHEYKIGTAFLQRLLEKKGLAFQEDT